MTAPALYNNFNITVTPEDLKRAGVDISGADKSKTGGWVGEIVDNLEAIGEAITDLKLGWAGETAEEAKAFFDTWTMAMYRLFGSKKYPKDGTLGVIGSALQYAGNNYDAAEDYIVNTFSALSTALSPTYSSGGDITAGSPSTAYLPPPAIWTTEWWQGAVSEVF
jgi:hypothetical protein